MSSSVALVLDGGGWPARAVMRSLGSAGWSLIAPEGTKAARSRWCTGRYRLPSAGRDVEAFTRALAQAIERWDPDLVVPAEDSSLEVLYDTPGLLGRAHVLGGDRRSAALALDKLATLRRAEAVGFPTPAYAVPADVDEAAAIAQRVGLPCVVKPRRSYAHRDGGLHSARLAYAPTAADARRAVLRYLELGHGMPLVQAWVPGRSIAVAAVVHQRRLLAWSAREAYSQYPIRGGTGVWRATVGADAPGVREALRFLVDVGFQGLGFVQCQVPADGRPRLMEIGARPYGSLTLTIAAGADLPLIAARALAGYEPPRTVVARPGVSMRWPAGEALRLLELLRPRVQLPPGERRRDALRRLWPPYAPGMRYDGVGVAAA